MYKFGGVFGELVGVKTKVSHGKDIKTVFYKTLVFTPTNSPKTPPNFLILT